MTALSWPKVWPAYGSVVLRPFTPLDLPLVAELASDPYVPLIGSVPAVFTEEGGLAYLERQHERLTAGTGWSFAIADRTDDRAVGGAGLWPQGSGVATAGYSLAPSARGRGYATAALHALTVFAWAQLELDRVELFIEPDNSASLRVAERCGYRRLELRPAHTEIDGTRRDMVVFAVLRP